MPGQFTGKIPFVLLYRLKAEEDYNFYERAHGSCAAPSSVCESVARAGGSRDCSRQARETELGRPQIRERLLRRLGHEVKVPATILAILDRHGLVTRANRSRTRAEGTPLSSGLSPNAVWCTDYKGEFLLGNKKYCYPLTVTDQASRYLLLCEAMESNQELFTFTAFERLFQERGLPQAMRSDNGVPFASPNGFSISPSSPFGGCAWASASNAFALVIRNRTGGTSACT